MAIKKKTEERKLQIHLTGQDGNAYALLGYAAEYAKQLKLNYGKISKEMKSGDYENLIKTFDNYFGEYVDLIR